MNLTPWKQELPTGFDDLIKKQKVTTLNLTTEANATEANASTDSQPQNNDAQETIP